MSAADFDPVFQSAGAQYGVDPAILKALAQQESNFNPKAVNPQTGAAGIMQYIPASAKAIGLDPTDPVASINQAAKDFSGNMQRFNGNVEQAVAAHFAGPDQKLWGPKTSQYVSDVAGKYQAIRQSGGFASNPSAAAPANPSQPDDIDAMLASRAQGKPVAPTAPAQNQDDPVDAMLAARASGQQFPASAAGGTGAAATQTAAGQANDSGMAQDMAAGGSSPYLLQDAKSAALAGAHGVGSMFNNAANFVERHLPFFPADIAAGDTAIQAASDQQWAQNATPGEKASAIVAPMILPMSGAMAPGRAVSAGIARLAGNVAPTVGKVVGNVAGNAVNGGILATGAPIDPNQPVGPQDARNIATGAALGAGLPAAFGVTKAIGSNVYNAARPILNPKAYVGQQFASQLGDDAANVAGNIRSAPQFVAGSVPTTAQAGQNPVLVATEKAQANSSPDFKIALAQRAIDNNDARWNALMGVAQSPEALAAAQGARADAVQPLYDQAATQTANIGPGFMKLMQRPAMQQAAQQADQLAANRGESLVWPQPGPTGKLYNSPNREISGRALDYTNQALGDMIGSAKASGNKSLAAGLADAQSQLQGWTQRFIPAQRQASQTYAQMSVPINTMDVGQQIANGLGTRAMNAGGAPEIGLMPFRSALTSAMGSGDAAKYGIDANALQQLQGIGQDLQRATISNGLKSPGSDTAYNVAANGWLARRLYGQNFQGGAIGRGLGLAAQAAGAAGGAALFGPGGAGVGSALGSGIGALLNGSRVGNRLNAEVNNLLLDPQALLPYLDARAAAPVNATQQALAAALRRNLLPSVVGGIARGSLVNAGN